MYFSIFFCRCLLSIKVGLLEFLGDEFVPWLSASPWVGGTIAPYVLEIISLLPTALAENLRRARIAENL